MYNTSTNISEDSDEWGVIMTTLLRNDPRWLQLLLCAILGIIFIMGLVGNMITCIVIYHEKTMHTITNFYLFNMSISDAIVSFGIIPDMLYAYSKEMNGYGDMTCKLHYFFVLLLWNTSILIMTILAIERYIGIWHPLVLKYSSPIRRVSSMMALIWVIALTESLSEVITMKFMRRNHIGLCYSVPSKYSKMINGILAIVTFIIPLTVMLYVYISIALKIKNNEKNNLRNSILKRKSNRTRVNKLLIAMTFSFLFCQLPYFCIRILFCFYNLAEQTHVTMYWVFQACIINGWLSIVLNPILFSLMSSKFRKALKILWRTKVQRSLHTEIATM